MTAMFSFLTGLFGAIQTAYKVIQLVVTLYKTLRDARRERRTEDAIDAIESGDSTKFEEAIGNPNAGKPSGIGKVRNKK